MSKCSWPGDDRPNCNECRDRTCGTPDDKPEPDIGAQALDRCDAHWSLVQAIHEHARTLFEGQVTHRRDSRITIAPDGRECDYAEAHNLCVRLAAFALGLKCVVNVNAVCHALGIFPNGEPGDDGVPV